MHISICLGVVLSVILGCAPRPYLQLRGAPIPTTSVGRPVFDASGLRLDITTTCKVAVVEHWCPLTNPRCRANPEMHKFESATCPKDVEVNEVSVRAPWGQVYPATVASGVLAVPIDWKSVNVDPFDEQASSVLRAAWVAHSEDGLVDASVEPTEGETRALRELLGVSIEGELASGTAGERTELVAAFATQVDADGGNRVSLAVTNKGPAPAYKVMAQLRSSSTALHGIQLSFGRIDKGETKTRTKDIDVGEGDERNPTVVAAVTAVNASPTSAKSRIRLATAKPRVELQLACSLIDREPAPGQRVRVHCEAINAGERGVRGVSYQLAIDESASITVPGPAVLGAHARTKFELLPTLPSSAKLGSSLQITITMSAPDMVPVAQRVAVEVVAFHGMCKQGKLTRDEYRKKRKRLESALAAGALSQDEFDKYDSELVSCIE